MTMLARRLPPIWGKRCPWSRGVWILAACSLLPRLLQGLLQRAENGVRVGGLLHRRGLRVMPVFDIRQVAAEFFD